MRALTALAPATLAIAGPAAAAQAESSLAVGLGLAAVDAQVDGRTALLVVSEPGQGGTDLNGDGDALDAVLFVHDAATGETKNLGLALGPGRPVFEHGLIVFSVDEAGYGADLNGDGDLLDPVLHSYEVATGTLFNLGLASPFPVTSDGRRIVAVVDEAQQGNADLNGDGDALDVVAAVHDVESGTTTDLGLALATFPKLAGDLVALVVYEPGQGATDLDGDGDAFDWVLHLHDLATGITTNLGLDTTTVYAERDHVAFLVRELEQGFVDLNGDGDVGDEVLHVHDVATGVTTNLGLAATGLLGAAGNVVFLVNEVNQDADLNGDGDHIDTVIHEHHFAGGRTANLGLASIGGLAWMEGRRLVFLASESAQGQDLNGDGDSDDDVLHTRDLVTRKTRNSGLAGTTLPALAGNLVGYRVSELEQGGKDLNGDGDLGDFVVHVLDLLSGTTTNLGLAATATWGEGNVLAFGVSESAQGGVDLNADGDTKDVVLHVWNPVLTAAENLGVAAGIPFQDLSGDVDVAVSLPSESSLGGDLNGDGDVFDQVPFVLRFDLPFGLTADADRVRLSAGDAQDLELDASPGAAGDAYLLLGSFSGTAPGTPVGAQVLPLAWDAYTQFTLQNPGSAILTGSLGMLDEAGEATARFVLPAGTDPALAGTTLHHAYAVFDLPSLAVEFASNAFGVELAP